MKEAGVEAAETSAGVKSGSNPGPTGTSHISLHCDIRVPLVSLRLGDQGGSLIFLQMNELAFTCDISMEKTETNLSVYGIVIRDDYIRRIANHDPRFSLIAMSLHGYDAPTHRGPNRVPKSGSSPELSPPKNQDSITGNPGTKISNSGAVKPGTKPAAVRPAPLVNISYKIFSRDSLEFRNSGFETVLDLHFKRLKLEWNHTTMLALARFTAGALAQSRPR